MDVHDKIIMQLQQRNVQLQQEKAEVELRLRQATALLSELQSVWMDLPPQLAKSINNILASQGSVGKSTQKQPPVEAKQPQSGGSEGKMTWMSFNLQDLLGCTASRGGVEPIDDNSPQAISHRRPSQNVPALDFSQVKSGTKDKGKESIQITDDDEPTEGPDIVAISARDMERYDMDDGATTAREVVDLLSSVPGATSLIAEIDMLCCALRKDAHKTRVELERRIHACKEEAQLHRQRIEEIFFRDSAAQNAELELCKSQLNELQQQLTPQVSFTESTQPKLCDAEWNRCQRMAELRTRAGHAHVEWLEYCFSQRLSAAESFRAMRQDELAEALRDIWQRKALLVSRFRERAEAAASSIDSKELVHIQQALESLEANTLAPLQALSDANTRQERETFDWARKAVDASRVQCKTACTHLTTIAEHCKEEVSHRIGEMNAVLMAYDRLRRHTLLSFIFGYWAAEIARARATIKDQELVTTLTHQNDLNTEIHSWKDRFQSSEAARAAAEQKMLRIQNIYDSDQVYEKQARATSFFLLHMAFTAWNLKRLTNERNDALEGLEAKRAEFEDASARLASAEVAVPFAQRRSARRTTLAIAFGSWATQQLRHKAQNAAQQEATHRNRTDAKLAELREHVLRVLDEAHHEGDDMHTPIRSRRPSRHSASSLFSVDSSDPETWAFDQMRQATGNSQASDAPSSDYTWQSPAR